MPTTLLDAVLIVAAVAIAYGRTLHVPFYLDDFSSIRENPLIYQWQGIEALWRFAPMRVLGYLSFRLNYVLGGFDPFGYHLVNLLVHALAGLAVYAFARAALRTPRLEDAAAPRVRRWLPVVAALLFVLHPLQTGAVTYIVQRLASLVALFYMTAMFAYVHARLVPSGPRRALWAAVCALATLLAFLSKENSATLPAAIVLIEAALFGPSRTRLIATAAGALGAMAVHWMLVAAAHGAAPWSAGALNELSRETPELGRGAYFATQLMVVLHYLRLAVFPRGLHLDYDFPVRDGLLHLDVLLTAGVHAVLILLAFRQWRRRPLVAFGLLFYYLAHAVESSVVPIRDVVFEHRAYLPNLGLALASSWVVLADLSRTPARARAAGIAIVVVLVSLAALTWARNEVWCDAIRFWRSNAALAPGKPRVWGTLGRFLLEANRPAEGIVAIERAMELRRAGHDRSGDNDIDALNMIWALRLLGRYDEAFALHAEYARAPLTPAMRARFSVNEGSIYFDQRRFAEAEAAFRRALALTPGSLPAMSSLAGTLAGAGRFAEAESVCVEVLRLDPDDRTTRHNLAAMRAQRLLATGQAMEKAGRPDSAVASYHAAQRSLAEAAQAGGSDSLLRNYSDQIQRLIDRIGVPVPNPTPR